MENIIEEDKDLEHDEAGKLDVEDFVQEVSRSVSPNQSIDLKDTTLKDF